MDHGYDEGIWYDFGDHGMCLVLWISWYWKRVWYILRDGGIQQKCNLVTELEEPIQLIVSNFILEQPFLLKILLKAIKVYVLNLTKNWSMDRFSENHHLTMVYDTKQNSGYPAPKNTQKVWRH